MRKIWFLLLFEFESNTFSAVGISSAPVKKNANRANEMAILFSYQQTVNLVTVCSF